MNKNLELKIVSLPFGFSLLRAAKNIISLLKIPWFTLCIISLVSLLAIVFIVISPYLAFQCWRQGDEWNFVPRLIDEYRS